MIWFVRLRKGMMVVALLFSCSFLNGISDRPQGQPNLPVVHGDQVMRIGQIDEQSYAGNYVLPFDRDREALIGLIGPRYPGRELVHAQLEEVKRLYLFFFNMEVNVDNFVNVFADDAVRQAFDMGNQPLGAVHDVIIDLLDRYINQLHYFFLLLARADFDNDPGIAALADDGKEDLFSERYKLEGYVEGPAYNQEEFDVELEILRNSIVRIRFEALGVEMDMLYGRFFDPLRVAVMQSALDRAEDEVVRRFN